MLRKISFGMLYVGMLFSANTMAMTHALAPNASIEYELPPNMPQLFTNYWIFTINAVCTVTTQDKTNLIHVKGINRSANVNGNTINPGDELDLVVKNGDQITLSAQPAVKVELTNKGEHSIKTVCRT